MMMTLKEFIKLAEIYGEDCEVFIEIDERSKRHFAKTEGKEIEEANGCTLASVQNFKPVHSKEGIILRLPIYQGV